MLVILLESGGFGGGRYQLRRQTQKKSTIRKTGFMPISGAWTRCPRVIVAVQYNKAHYKKDNAQTRYASFDSGDGCGLWKKQMPGRNFFPPRYAIPARRTARKKRKQDVHRGLSIHRFI